MEARGTILLIWALAAPLVASPLVYLLPRYTARLRGRPLDLTYKEFELL
jgi:hypothetical protein